MQDLKNKIVESNIDEAFFDNVGTMKNEETFLYWDKLINGKLHNSSIYTGPNGKKFLIIGGNDNRPVGIYDIDYLQGKYKILGKYIHKIENVYDDYWEMRVIKLHFKDRIPIDLESIIDDRFISIYGHGSVIYIFPICSIDSALKAQIALDILFTAYDGKKIDDLVKAKR